METVAPSSVGWADSLQVLWQDGEIAFCRGWRLEDGGKPAPIFAVTPTSDHPPAALLDRLTNEYGLKDELDEDWALRPLELLRDGGRVVLVLSDPGGAPLDRLLDGRPTPVERFLPLAIQIAAALGAVHGRGLIHKDIKPAHIIVDEASGAVRLTGFGIARRAPKEHPELGPPELIAGALAYMAPEQTGRMNRSVDSRSDLYALGVTFYQMLTGVLPFVAAEPIEWVHCHMARRPAPPAERVAGLPRTVSAMVMKLLAKTAEDRYQTAAGVVADLERCLAEWRAHGEITPFPLGAHDLPTELRIPEKLYGREPEVAALLAAFERVAAAPGTDRGRAELVLVGGHSGIGKSSVVHELHKAIVPRRGLFASGKFDQHQRDIPHATIAQAFRRLLRQILAQPDEAVAGWRAAILEAVAPNGRLVADLIPELELVIGKQPECPRLGPEEAQHRFQTVWRRFVGVFAQPEHPLVLFLDDLQWLDAATLKLLAHLVIHPEVRNVLFIGAYRDNEVGPGHPLRAALDDIRKAGAKVQEIILNPLSGEDVHRLVSDTLGCGERAAPLARLLHRKTSGNPFFVMQFLTTLQDEGLLTLDAAKGAWTWDIRRIEAKRYTDNVVDLMVEKLKRLPERTQEALKAFACLGNSADIGALALADLGSPEATHAALSTAVREGLVYGRGGSYHFLHDRIQEAAYALIPEPLRAEAHVRIGRRLLSELTEEALHERIFEIVNQFNRGAPLVTAQDERDRIAQLNLIAGLRAKQATAYAAARTYLSAGAALLAPAPDRWERTYRLSFELEFHHAECEFLTSAFDSAEARLSDLSRRAANPSDSVAVSRLRLATYNAIDRVDLAVAACLEHLRQMGIACTPDPSDEEVAHEYNEICRRIGDRPIDALLDLPQMSDPDWRATMDLLVDAQPSALRSENLHALLSARMVNLSLEHGAAEGSCFAYVIAGSILSRRFGDYFLGCRLSKLGVDLVEQGGLDRFAGRVYTAFADMIIPWMRNIRHGLPILRRGFEVARESGDLVFTVASRIGTIRYLLATGEPLAQAQEEAERAYAFVRDARFGAGTTIIGAQLALIRDLRGLPPSDPTLTDQDFERRLAVDPTLLWGGAFYFTRKLQSLVFAGDYWAAVDVAAKAERQIWAAPFFDAAEYHLFAALAHAGAYATASSDERRQSRAALARHHAQLAEWADICPENFEDRAALVAAEMARLDGRELDAIGLYEQAIACARRSGFVQNEALANELACAFYLSQGWESGGMAHLRNARACYAQWGAEKKIRQLDQRHPRLAPFEGGSAAATLGSSATQLDIGSVVQASQAISGQIELDKLIETLMTIAIQNVGADRGLLILPGESSHEIAAEARAAGDEIAVAIRGTPIAEAAVPASVVRYVMRTREYVLLDDTTRPHPYADDPYFRAQPARSILCLPLIKQTRLAGVLYLENAVTAQAFTPDRLQILNLLAAQAVISLENAHLYSELQQREAKIRHLVDANIIGIYFWDSTGRLLAANDIVLDILGYTRQDLESGTIRWANLTPPEQVGGEASSLALLRATGTSGALERELIRKDGRRVPVLVGAARFEGDKLEGVGFVLDLTERKQADLRQKILIDELNHRVKNTLATVQSICAQTLRSADSPQAFREEFDGRLAALSQTHNVLNQSGWQGASLRQILEKVLAPHGVACDGRCELHGQDVSLGPSSAVTFGMAFHELVTNALKYGALSTPAGRVRIGWQVRAPGRLHIIWQEFGGPAVEAPRRRGFGSRLIERSLPAQISGAVHLEFAPEGVRCEMDGSLDEICKT